MKPINIKTLNINWVTIQTNIIVAFVFLAFGLIGGYFSSINIISGIRAEVINDFTVVRKAK